MADLVGTLGNDTLRINPGGPFYERFYGLAGDDLLIARGSDPVFGMYGGTGNDTYSINSHGPSVYENVGEGYDVVYVTTDNYALVAGQEIELLLLEDAASTYSAALFGNEFAQGIAGNNGANEFFGRGGADTLIGLKGNDIYHVVDPGTIVIEAANEGGDTVYTTVSYRLTAGSYVETLRVETGFTGAINLTGNEFAQGIVGNDAANILNGGGGADTLQGLGGDDIYQISDSTAVVWESPNKGYDIVFTTVSYTLGAGESIELLLADDAALTTPLTLWGNALAQGIAGNAGDNLIVGGGGADTLIGRGGNDIYGVWDATARVWEAVGEGYDIVYTTVSYTLEAGQEIEQLLADGAAATTALTLVGNEFAQTIAGNAGANVLRGGGGADLMIGRGGDDVYYVTSASARVWEAANEGRDIIYTTVSYALETNQEIEQLLADGAASTTPLNLYGNALSQTIAGNAGANVIYGGGGNDILIGRGGNDLYYAFDNNTQVQEAVDEGYDIVYTRGDFTLQANQEIEQLMVEDAATTNPVTLYGNNLAQSLAGNAGNNILISGGGADTMIGRGGNDQYYLNDSNARVLENVGEGYDIVFTTVSFALEVNQEIEQLMVENGASTNVVNLTGNNLSQSLAGNQGANILDGGLGNDTLVGRGGADSFVFSTALGPSNVDWIYDFEPGIDKILIDDAVFAGLTPGALAAGAFVIGSAALDADDRIIYDNVGGRLLFDADGSGAGAAVQFAIIGTGLAITASDFSVV